jgi:hypothetical protein
MKRFFLCTILIWLVFSGIYSQDNAINNGLNVLSEKAIRAQLDFLASDWMEGRETGEKGIDMAADYIASMFQVYGLQPADFLNVHEGFAGMGNRSGGTGSRDRMNYFQEFALMKTEKSDDHELAVITETSGTRKTTRFAYSNDFSFMNRPIISQEGEFPVVFVGYGLIKKEVDYDDYAGVNVKGKVVVRLIGFPGHCDTVSTAYKKFHPDGNEWTKYREELDRNELAVEKGAVAVIVINTTRDITLDFAKNVFRYNFGDYEGDVPPVSSHTNRMYFPGDTVSKSIPAFLATHRIANELTTGTKVSLESFEKQVQETMKPDSRELRDKKVYFRQTVKTSVIAARNVLGMIEGKNPNEIVVVGAHYDHLGKYDGKVYNGSDDNASGTVAVMSIARACMATGIKPERTLIFAAWTAEEKGLLGSEFFIEHPPAGKIITYLNYDMISRNDENDSSGVKCSMTYTQSFSTLEDISRKYNEQYGLGLQIQYKPREKPTGGSDHNAFVHKNIPVCYYMAGWHDDYHKPGDHPEKANIEKMTRIAKLGFLSLWDIANGDDFPARQ